jgi:predicted nucleic acid-binding protein
MMKTIDISTYIPKNTDNFIIDTNIWLYLFCPIGSYNALTINYYEKFMVKIIKNNSKIFITSLIISEFINRYFRIDFDIKKNLDPINFKDYKRNYRGSADFLNTSNTIRATLRQQIIKISKIVDDEFSKYDLKKILNEIDIADYNDLCLGEISSLNNYKIITHDSDFKKISNSIEILTANPVLLKK